MGSGDFAFGSFRLTNLPRRYAFKIRQSPIQDATDEIYFPLAQVIS
jgi:hypothetical protein